MVVCATVPLWGVLTGALAMVVLFVGLLVTAAARTDPRVMEQRRERVRHLDEKAQRAREKREVQRRRGPTLRSRSDEEIARAYRGRQLAKCRPLMTSTATWWAVMRWGGSVMLLLLFLPVLHGRGGRWAVSGSSLR